MKRLFAMLLALCCLAGLAGCGREQEDPYAGAANPIATILSAAMLLRYSLDQDAAADAIEAAVRQVLKDGYRTVDIMSEGCTQVGTEEMGARIAERIR